jgi:hypothetical protein
MTTATTRRTSQSLSELLADKGRSERSSDQAASGFDLRATLAETEVHEASFADFLAVLRSNSKQPA